MKADGKACGSCLCGGVRFEITLPASLFVYCHCSSCRKTTSSAHAANLLLPPGQFRWITGEDRIRRYIDETSNPGYKRFFCGTCGSAVPRLTRNNESMVVQAGLLDNDPGMRPDRSIHWSDRSPWYVDVDALPRFPEGPTSPQLPDGDFPAAHARFSARCFNEAWEHISRKDRSEEETLAMLDLAHASLWHWTRRADGTARNLAISYWQLSRVYALAGSADFARVYGLRSLEHTGEAESFYRGFAHEALARAAMVAGDRAEMDSHLAEARQLAGRIEAPEDAVWLLRNLEDISLPPEP